jgi:hypothetical protein
MNPRQTWFWLVLAAVLFGLVFARDRYFRGHEPGSVKVVPNLKPSAVESIEITLTNSAELRAERTAGGWTLTKPLSYPAQAASIEALLARLERLTPATSVRTEELKNRPKADEEFGFSNPQASILIQQQGDARIRLLLGSKTAPGDQFFLQVVGAESVYVVDATVLRLVPRTVNDWRDRTVLDLRTLAFDRIAVTNGTRIFELQRDSTNSPWRMVRPFSARADGARIEQALDNLQSLRITQFVSDDPKADLESLNLQPPDMELTFSQGSNSVALLQFGKTNNAGQVYARRGGQNTIVTVANELVEPWRAPANDFRDLHLLVLTRPVDAIEVRGEESFSVQRQTNDAWRVLPQDLPTDEDSVKELISVLGGLHIEFVQGVVTEASLATNYGLAPPLRQYTFYARAEGAAAASNNVLAELQFGTNQPGKVFVRRTDEPAVYSIPATDFQRLPSSGWQMRGRRLWNFSDDDIAGATVRKDGKTCQIIRKERYHWSFAPGSQGLIKNELALEETVRGLAQVTAASWVARGDQSRARYGFHDGGLQITLELKNGDKATVEFGAEAPSNFEYAAVVIQNQVWIFEFPWLLFRDVLSSLPIP